MGYSIALWSINFAYILYTSYLTEGYVAKLIHASLCNSCLLTMAYLLLLHNELILLIQYQVFIK
jgi:hypothetical protein